MNKMNRSLGRAIVAGAATTLLAGCVTRTVYVTAPPPQPPAPAVVVTPPPAPPPPAVEAVVVIRTENDFYEPLSPYGEWVVVESYGRCWRPLRVEAGWRPYASGRWQRTDAGWFWASDEPWGWATYHYGRWDWTPRYGWIWVPQTEWAPAWVSWREGAGYVGWAPLPPAARISVSGSVEIGDAVLAPRFVFVEERRLVEPVRPTTVIVNNTTVVNKTVNITKIKVVNKTVINEGPRTEVVERAAGRRIDAMPVHDMRHREETEFTARKRNAPAVTESNPQPPVRRDTEPAKAVLPRTSPPVATPVETVKERRPTTAGTKTGELEERKSPGRAERPEGRGIGRGERKPETVPVVAKPEPKPAVPRDIPVKEPARVEKPVTPRVVPASTETRQVGKPMNPGIARSEAARSNSAPGLGRQNENVVKSPKAAANEDRGAGKKKGQPQKKDEQPEKPAGPGQ